MFVQVIQGKVTAPEEARAALDRWASEVAPGADGWLGVTAGVTEDGTFLSIARFESAEAAQRNSDRPEQGQWWTQTAKLFSGEATFRNSTRVLVDLVGDPDQAGFVQVIQARSSDPDRVWELMSHDSAQWVSFRPDIIGSLAVDHGDDAYTTVLYFTTEEEARVGERKEMPPELKAEMEEMEALSVGTPQFFDLTDPWLYSAG